MGARFIDFLQEELNKYNNTCVNQVPVAPILVAYNSCKFDIPFLYNILSRNNLSLPNSFRYYHNPYELVLVAPMHPVPNNKKLSTIYKMATNQELKNSHSALADVRAMLDIM